MEFFLSLWAKVIGSCIVLILLVAGAAYLHHSIYESGYNDALAAQTKTNADQAKVNLDHKNAAETALAVPAKAASIAIDHSLDLQPVQIKTVKVLVHDNPTFAACVRPVALVGVREASLEAIRAAAGASPYPAPASSSGL